MLVGQYESFILPLAVILSLPVGLFGSFFFLQAMGLANDVYAQIGLVMLVGLLGKNAILIVEFAVQRRLEGVSLQEAAVEGAKLRFRPIQMTSFAFIAGLLPLVVASGAGAIGNRTIGTTGAGGMLVGTVIGVLVIPGLYYLFGQLDGGRKLLKDETHGPLSEIAGHHEPKQKKNTITFTFRLLLVLPSCATLHKLDRTFTRTTILLLKSANCALSLAFFDGPCQRMSDKPTIQTVGKVEI